MSNSFDFYKMFYQAGYLSIADLQEATKWKVITADEYVQITGQKYTT